MVAGGEGTRVFYSEIFVAALIIFGCCSEAKL